MKKIVLFVLMLAFAAEAIAGCSRFKSGESFKSFESQNGGFKALFPEKPQREVKSIDEETVPYELVTYHVENGDLSYAICYTSLPQDVAKSANENADKFLDGARDGAVKEVKNAGAELDKEVKITQGKYPGRELTFKADGKGTVLKQRLYLGKDRMFQVIVETKDGGYEKSVKDIEKFLNSFRILD